MSQTNNLKMSDGVKHRVNLFVSEFMSKYEKK